MSKARGPYRVDPLGYKKANEALDKMAENARELGLDYEPAQQEPVAYLVDGDLYYPEEIDWETLQEQGHTVAALYTSPQPAQQETVTDEENEKFSRDVSNFKGADPEATKHALEEFLKGRMAEQTEQRTWVGLTLEDMETTHWSPDFRAGAKWAAAKLKEKNT